MKDKNLIFKDKANLVHNKKYNYDFVNYIHSKIKVKIYCLTHGEFEQSPNTHLRGGGCPKCNNSKTKNIIKTKYLIQNLKNNENYDYSLVNYINDQTKIKIICKKHGEFEQLPKFHLNGFGCQKCKYDKITLIIKLDTNQFIEKAKKIHNNKYNYDLVNYINSKNKVKIICNTHGQFELIAGQHLIGRGCQLCSSNKLNNNLFIEKAKVIHGDIYNYDLVKYFSSKINVKINCLTHGVFEQKPNHHLSGAGCPICKESRGEREIKDFLLNNNIEFIRQYKFLNCKNKRQLPFDFYLPLYNICIEFNGRQHYEEVIYWGGDKFLEKQKNRDRIKKEFCETNNIKLLIIDDIKEIKKLKLWIM